MSRVVALWSAVGVAAPIRAAASSVPAHEASLMAPSSMVPASVMRPIRSGEVPAGGYEAAGVWARAVPPTNSPAAAMAIAKRKGIDRGDVDSCMRTLSRSGSGSS